MATDSVEDLFKGKLIRGYIAFGQLLYICLIGMHALVKFVDEDSTAVVPVTRLLQPKADDVGDFWLVLWTNKKKYKASFIMSG